MRWFPMSAVLCLSGAAALFAQVPASNAPVVGVGNFIHVVSNLDKTMEFYGGRLGLEPSGAPGRGAFSPNAVVEHLYDAKGSQSRVAAYKVPGSPVGLEFVEFQGIAQKAVRPRGQDPGASVMTVPVRNSVIGGGDTALVQDPDGFFVQLVREGQPAKLSLTVDDMDRTLRLFRDLLGFQPGSEQRAANGIGPHPWTSRAIAAKVPGTAFEVTFVEYSGAERKPASPAIHDPGAGVLRLLARDGYPLLDKLKAAGVPVVSAGGQPMSIGTRQFAILRDPDNFFIQIVSQTNSASNLTPAAK